ncbi:MAG: hypothetical protein IFK94_11470 [Acidobacteria bacterium]|uniref:Cytochrome b/b6 C-terminal region profile domain-containing protein n=1 Tax=Candidatus Polarisedimenticola svalbardensis TaxID=2886004 RepID=A0A8J6Y3Q9_9BACT|nr:hypothetical protein [Candidatus Polarisedimenticola svalbardensis]
MKGYELQKDNNPKTTPKRVALIVRGQSARRVEDRGETVPTAPNLLLREIVIIQACIILLAVMALLFDAPLEGIADPRHTPNPAKAAWYFLGLQELLHYFPPVVAGVLLPGLAVLGLAVVPFVRVNWETVGFYEQRWRGRLLWVSLAVALTCGVMALYLAWPVIVPTLVVYGLLVLPAIPAVPERLRARLGRVPLADWIMTWFVAETVFLTLIGILFRGPGWSWIWPWRAGLY